MIVGVIGATGYAGAELVRLLSGHAEVTGLSLSSVSYEGERIEEVYPNFLSRLSVTLDKAETVIQQSAVVFSALPHGVGEEYGKRCVEKGIPFIDISADFRFGEDEETYAAWYGRPYTYPELRQYAVYGLPELNRRKIKDLAAAGRVIIGNPGCYPTAASLGAFPALAPSLTGNARIAGKGTVIVDAASGITGGGREPGRAFHYPECADAVIPYKVGCHRHTPEIHRNFAAMAGENAPEVIFTPHLAPMNRGILSTAYIPLAEAWKSRRTLGASRPPDGEIEEKTGKIRELYAAFYRDEPFVRLLPPGVIAVSNRVRQSNFCDISIHLDQAGTTLIIESAIDNMVKGAAGQAIQNMNIIFGFDETTGLTAIPALF
jgi:N-acetyl-gamma-glutamyl-phosphate reductase